jgi:molybdopterin-guanine dinucleotide biosynthesis protein A
VTPVDLIMPMAGAGSRFIGAGFAKPKPLLRLDGRPFFWWAAESVSRCFDVRRMIFVVLREHMERHRIHDAVLSNYAGAELVILDEMTPGALATAARGCSVLHNERWLLVNYCDHAFDAISAATALPMIAADADAFFCYATADKPAPFDAGRPFDPGYEWPCVGACGFRNRDTFLTHARAAMASSGDAKPGLAALNQSLAAHGKVVRGLPLDRYVGFRTPEEYDEAAAGIAVLRPVLRRAVHHG